MRRSTIAKGALACVCVGGALTAWTAHGCDTSSSETTHAWQHASQRTGFRWPRWSLPVFTYEVPTDAGVMQANFGDGGSADAGVDGRPEYPMLEAALCAPLARTICDRRTRCGCHPASGCFEREMDKCRSWLGCSYPMGEENRAVDDRVLRDCIAGSSRDDGCTSVQLANECWSVLVDAAHVGEECREEYSSACVGGTCTEGTCVAHPDMPCGGCGPRMYCDGNDVCQIDPNEPECGSGADCAPGHYCAREYVCRPEGQSGAECDPEYGWMVCAPHHLCDDSGHCVSPARCEADNECGRGDMCVGTVRSRCVVGGVFWPLRAAGGECGQDQDCAEFLLCDRGRCVPAPGEGELCPLWVCSEGLACAQSPDARRCQRRVPRREGEPCGPDDVCERGLGCLWNESRGTRCTRLPSIDEQCESECAPGLRCNPSIVDGRCTPVLCEEDVDPTWQCATE